MSGHDERADRPRRSLRITRHTPDVTRDVDDEVAFHLEMRTREFVEQGMDPDEARRAAARAFGDRERVAGQVRDLAAPDVRREQRAEWWGSIARDVRFALRGLVRQPSFALIAIVTLGLCIGANVAVFTVVNTVVLRPLPFPEADRLVTFFNAYPGSGIERTDNAVPDYYDRGENMASLEHVALYNQVSATIGEPGAAANVFVSWVSPPFFDVLGVQPAIGRGFVETDGVVGDNTNIVVSHGFWQSHFGGADDVLGRTLDIEDRLYTVVGVMPESFEFVTWNAQIWFTLAFAEERRTAYHRNNWNMIGRMTEGATVAQAQEQLDALNVELLSAYSPENRASLEAAGFRSVVRGWQDDLMRDFRTPLYLLWASVALVLLIGCFNIANLLLLRLGSRLRELSTRFVLGASRWRLARQLFTESLVLTLAGGALGLALASWSLRFLDLFEHYQVPRMSEVRPDAATVGFTLLASIAVAGLAATLPVVVIRRGDLFGAFRGAPGNAPGSDAGSGSISLRGVLVAGQVAAAFVLVTTGGLLLLSLMNLWAVDTGFDTDNLSAGALLLTADRYPDAAARAAFRRGALEAIEAMPGVSSAAFATQLPFSGEEHRLVFFAEGYDRADDEAINAHFNTSVTPGFFETMAIPLLDGRNFDDRDVMGAPGVMIVDEHMAQRYWPGENPIGRRVAFNTRPAEDEEWMTVIGVARTIVQNDLDQATPPGAFYRPAAQTPEMFWRLVVRTDGLGSAAFASIRDVLTRLDPQMPYFWSITMEGAIAERLIPRRIPMILVLGFAAVAMALTTLGVYGVLAFAATRRTKEIGIRIALGSSAGEIYRLMLREAAFIIGAGLALGLLGSLAVGRLLASQLYGVRPGDPFVLALVALTVAAIALFASLVPTSRATRTDPMTALRQE